MRGPAKFWATGFGLGYAPFASGTWGSLPAIPLHVAAVALGGWWLAAAGALLTALTGWWATATALPQLDGDDPSEVVVDEVAGQWISLLFLPVEPLALIAGFVCFRIFDILKPPPARGLERLHGASGIMADDLAAGVYGGVAAWALLLLRTGS